ncbi:succinate dehydrogenase, cytochrome b556 subunit [Thiothrix nivea]|uniref:Succinate dehydrogenase cytochrome b556 subunit n=1 Tax=Thiothrix nivea (strain ATCC 35100 / DSM 5205 / JP2) TaxID=870187 RepID=A0A656HC29_THINJ|nr:succinate dehydrogenase, cytochrome b556 subunit [Thiothrix nivea]EIJ32966.1 succinate dehydrogenase, cytochrome b556 subunit [Thiothrix nivea DSM 5205]
MKNTSNRPLSPHLQVYKMPLPAILSVLHRGTGIVLAIGTILVAWWLAAIAGGEESFNTANAILGSWFGKLVLFGWSWTLFYHLCNGIRHLVWDTGFGLDLPTVYLGGKVVIAASFVLTILLWIVA